LIRKLRLKFVAICMALVTAILAVVFFSVYFAMQRNIEDLSRQLLHRVIQQDDPRHPEIAISLDRDRVVYLPYFTVNVWGSTAYVTGGTYTDLEDTEVLAAILNDCLSQNRQEGVVQDYHLRYLRRNNGLYEKLAFVDMSMEQAMLREMMGSYLIIGGTALLLLLAVAVLLSWWATQPVERAWRQQRQFLSDASHELKTPLAAIRLLTDSILQNENMDNATAREFVSDIGNEAERLSRITEDLLRLTRLDSGVAEPPRLVEAAPVLERVARMLRPVAEEKGVELLIVSITGAVVLATEGELHQILYNLAENAIKYNRPGGRVRVTAEPGEESTVLTVEDNGIGIPAEDLSNVFKRFYRVDKARSRAAGGTGLGLSIVSDTVSRRGGAIRAENVEGGGTRFIVTLPSMERGEEEL